MRDEALFFNGVYEVVLQEIVDVQAHLPEQILFLQIHSTRKVGALRDTPPSVDDPMQLYVSLTTELDKVAFTAEIVGWDHKPDLPEAKRHLVARMQALLQPVEVGMVFDNGMVNLIHVRRMSRLEEPFSVSSLVKVSDGEPLSTKRTTSGGWSMVQRLE